MTDEPIVQDTATITPAGRNRWRFENGAAVVAFEGVDTIYAISALPENVKTHLMFAGIVATLGRSDDREGDYAKLVSGDIRERKPPVVKVDNWRLAIALAMVDFTKKMPSPMTLDAAKVKASAFDAAQVRAKKTDPKVVTHYNKLAGVTVGFAELLDDAA